MTRPDDDLPWPPPPSRQRSRADLLAPSTQIVGDRETYLGLAGAAIGRRIGDDHYELFVSGDPVAALQQQFARVEPDAVVLHDIGTHASLRLLGALAGAAGARVQRLSIRRQGEGMALAVLQFVEAPLAGGGRLRIYSTDSTAHSQTRQQLSLVLLAHSRLGVLMVGELPPHALSASLLPLHQALAGPGWRNRELLMLPLGSATALAAQAAALTGDSKVEMRVTPHAERPTDAWAYVSGAWNRGQARAGSAATLVTELAQAVPRPPLPRSEAPTQRMELDESPALAPAPSQPMPVPGAARWDDYAAHCLAIKGMLSCCVFDLHSQRPLAHAGKRPPAARLTAQGVILLTAISDAGRALGLGSEVRELAVTLADHHLLLHPVPRHPGIVLHAVLDAAVGSPTLVRQQLERLQAP
ncbi:MAG: hypothetical protein Q8N44_14470 [Rubrivivax sp.]|nr:hypothetical protein [Rubrivivax sp.]